MLGEVHVGSGARTRRTTGGRTAPSHALLLLGKAGRAGALMLVAEYLHTSEEPLLVFLCAVLAGTAVVLLGLQRPWRGRKLVTPKQLARTCWNGSVMIVTSLLWLHSLRILGPTRVVLYESVEVCALFMVGVVLGYRPLSGPKRRALGLMILAYILLLWTDVHSGVGLESAHTHEEEEEHRVEETPMTESHYGLVALFSFPWFSAGLSVLCAGVLNAWRKSASRHMAHEIGGVKREHALLVTCAAMLSLPAASVAYFVKTPSSRRVSPALLSHPLTYVVAVLFGAVMNFYVDVAVGLRLDSRVVGDVGLLGTFFFSWVLSPLQGTWGIQSSTLWVELVCLVLIVTGMHILGTRDQESADTELIPLYGGMMPGSTPQGTLRFYMRQFAENPESQRIFVVLLVTVGWMVAEVMFGLAINALVLLADAAHMLLEAGSLGIGLVASVSSKWKATPMYTYGYARFEVLAAFVNAVFVAFASFFLFVEGLERLLEPPHVHSEHLLAAALAGVGFNVVAMVFLRSRAWSIFSHSRTFGGTLYYFVWEALTVSAVVFAAVCIHYWGIREADAVASLFIGILILVRAFPLAKRITNVLLQRVPEEFMPVLRECLYRVSTMEGVLRHHDGHFWTQSEGVLVGTLAIVIAPDFEEQHVLKQVSSIFKQAGVTHLALQVEKDSFREMVRSVGPYAADPHHNHSQHHHHESHH